MVTAKQKANQARFAAMARAGAFRKNTRGATSTGGGFAKGFLGGSSHKSVHDLKAAFHRISWGMAALSFLAAYYIPQTLTNLGVGWILYDRSPQYSQIVDAGYNASEQMGNPFGFNPWGNGGLIAVGKATGVGYAGKKLYDWSKGKAIGKGALNVGLPGALGLILDGPELAPSQLVGHPGGGLPSGGGVVW